MLRAFIVDDEPLARDELAYLLRRSKQVDIVGQAESVETALDTLQDIDIDAVFLDIQLEDGCGMEIANKLNELEYPPLIVFATAYDEYALKAFEVNALDYLLKPIEPKRLADAIHKLQYEITKERSGVNGANRGPLTEADQVFVKDGERCWFVKLSEIRLFESVGNYAKVFFATNKPLILKSLNSLEERLDDRVFFRANRKHIINLRWIEKIEPYFNGGLLVELKGGEKIEVSRRQTVKFKEMMSF